MYIVLDNGCDALWDDASYAFDNMLRIHSVYKFWTVFFLVLVVYNLSK